MPEVGIITNLIPVWSLHNYPSKTPFFIKAPIFELLAMVGLQL